MSKITGLSSGPINGTDSLTVELVEADETPAAVMIPLAAIKRERRL